MYDVSRSEKHNYFIWLAMHGDLLFVRVRIDRGLGS